MREVPLAARRFGGMVALTDLFVIDVDQVEDRVHCRGVERDGTFRCLAIDGFRPHFYFGPVGDEETVDREAALRAACQADVRVSVRTRVALCGYGAARRYLRVDHGCGVDQRRVVAAARRTFSSDAAADAVEDGVPVVRRFLVETQLSGGSWLSCATPPEAGDAPWTVAWRDVTGRCPDVFREDETLEERPEDEAIPELRRVALQVCAASGRGDTWAEGQRTDDAVRAVAVASDVRTVVFVVDGFTRTTGRVRRFRSEAAALRAVEAYLLEVDPDVVLSFDNRGLGLLGERFEVVVGRRLRLARGAPKSGGWRVKSVATYSKDWIRSRSEGGRRMASSNNLETHRLDGVEGRLCVDVLRFASMRASPKLTLYTLREACEVLGVAGPPAVEAAARRTLETARLASLAMTEAAAVAGLADRMNCVAETVELARATGLDLGTIGWRAASVRTEQLLLKAGRAFDVALNLNRPAAAMTTPWAEDTTPFLMHPAPLDDLQPHQRALVDSGLMGHRGAAGAYDDPVVVLDFASLYPSVFIAHNVCYTTLLFDEEDASRTECHEAPTTEASRGAAWRFATTDARDGFVPRALRALLRARKRAKRGCADAKRAGDARLADCLDARQLSLKMCANATYGFTGSNVSSLEGKPLAEACVRWGNAYCRDAIALVEDGTFPGARVVYSQTDSVFVRLPGRGRSDAEAEGARIAAHVSAKLPPQLTLEYETTLQPFLLLHVNRYAGAKPDGSLMLKGVGSARGSCAFVRATLRDVAEELLVPGRGGVEGALRVAARRIDDLLAGDVDAGALEAGAFLWRVDHGDLARIANNDEKLSSKEDLDGLRTPHVALAARTLKRDPKKRYRLGEFVPHLVGRGCRGDAQKDMALDPREALRNEAPIDLKLYFEKKLKPDLERLLEHFPGANRRLFARPRPASPGVLALGTDARALFDASKGDAPPASPPRCQTLRDRSLLAGGGEASKCVRCDRSTDDDAKTAAFCRDCWRGGDKAATYVALLAAQRALDREVLALGALRTAAARRADVPVSAVTDGAPRLLNAARRLRAVDAKLDRDFLSPPRAAPPPPPPPPRKKKRPSASSPFDLDSSRRALFPVAAAADRPPAGAWTCDFCTYVHVEPREFAFLACGACGTERPKAISPEAKRPPPPPRTP